MSVSVFVLPVAALGGAQAPARCAGQEQGLSLQEALPGLLVRMRLMNRLASGHAGGQPASEERRGGGNENRASLLSFVFLPLG